MFIKRDAFGKLLFIKRLMILFFGVIVYYRHNVINKTKLEGVENLLGLPKQRVLFVSNHQTYFSDVAMFFLVFAAAKNGFINKLKYPWYLLNPRLRLYFVAAVETMKAGLLPKIFTYAGSISIKRTWRASGQDVKRQVDLKDITKIGDALDDGWVITFPQGTTTPFKQGRKGTGFLIKKFQPIVVPIVIDGFRRAFDKKGLRLKKKGVTLSVRIKEPMKIDYSLEAEEIILKVMDAIEQTPDYSYFPLNENPN